MHRAGDISYEVMGSGEPIIFLHGFSLDHRMWQPQVEYFKDTYQTIVYDLRGFGESALPQGRYGHHEDLKFLLDHLKINTAHLVGLSLGGEVAIDFSILHPDRVRSLTVIDSSLGGYESTVDWRVYAQEQGIQQAKRNWINHDVFTPSCRNKTVTQQLKTFVNDYSGWHWLHQDPRIKLDPPAMKRLVEITVPTRILVGELDLDYYHQIADVLVNNIPNSQLHVIPDTGHMANLENPSIVNQLIEKQL